MTERLIDGANDAAKNAEARAPLSSYLRDDSLADSQESWTIISSDDESAPKRTPNLSVLKQIKNFLNAKSGESDVPFDSSSQRFRVDYPYYAPDSEKESPASTLDENPPLPLSILAMQSNEAEESNNAEVEQKPISFDKEASISENRSETGDSLPVQIYSEDDGTGATAGAEEENASEPNRIETVASLTSDGLGREENDVFVCSPAPQKKTSETTLQNTTTQTSNLLDVAEISENNDSDVKKPMVYYKNGEENDSLETVAEKQFIPSTKPTSARSPQSVDSFEKLREEKSHFDENASKTIVQRNNSYGRLSIFRRFVDLVATRNGTEFSNHNLNNQQDLSRRETVAALTQEDYSREICICDAYESGSSMEVLVAPCYVGTNMTFQY